MPGRGVAGGNSRGCTGEFSRTKAEKMVSRTQEKLKPQKRHIEQFVPPPKLVISTFDDGGQYPPRVIISQFNITSSRL